MAIICVLLSAKITGQAPINLDWKSTQGEKNTIQTVSTKSKLTRVVRLKPDDKSENRRGYATGTFEYQPYREKTDVEA